METKRDKTQLTKAIIDLFVSTIGFIPRDAVTLKTNFIRDFAIIDDDLTCFMMQVKWQYQLKPEAGDWERIETIEEVVDLILAKPDL
ncbi:acyl carrier protein [Pseudomonas sp. Pseusp122]|jgi:acyl carrier protein|uniref:acyl carrier protein n=1 Tax=unclassified Pseudomonas TaxID=196821 RepID=UPI0039A683FA